MALVSNARRFQGILISVCFSMITGGCSVFSPPHLDDLEVVSVYNVTTKSFNPPIRNQILGKFLYPGRSILEVKFKTSYNLIEFAKDYEVYSEVFDCSGRGASKNLLFDNTIVSSRIYWQSHDIVDLAWPDRNLKSETLASNSHDEIPYVYSVFLAMPKRYQLQEDVCLKIIGSSDYFPTESRPMIIGRTMVVKAMNAAQ